MYCRSNQLPSCIEPPETATEAPSPTVTAMHRTAADGHAAAVFVTGKFRPKSLSVEGLFRRHTALNVQRSFYEIEIDNFTGGIRDAFPQRSDVPSVDSRFRPLVGNHLAYLEIINRLFRSSRALKVFLMTAKSGILSPASTSLNLSVWSASSVTVSVCCRVQRLFAGWGMCLQYRQLSSQKRRQRQLRYILAAPFGHAAGNDFFLSASA